MKEALEVLFSRLNSQQIFALGGIAMTIHSNPQAIPAIRTEALREGLFDVEELDCFLEIMNTVFPH